MKIQLRRLAPGKGNERMDFNEWLTGVIPTTLPGLLVAGFLLIVVVAGLIQVRAVRWALALALLIGAAMWVGANPQTAGEGLEQAAAYFKAAGTSPAPVGIVDLDIAAEEVPPTPVPRTPSAVEVAARDTAAVAADLVAQAAPAAESLGRKVVTDDRLNRALGTAVPERDRIVRIIVGVAMGLGALLLALWRVGPVGNRRRLGGVAMAGMVDGVLGIGRGISRLMGTPVVVAPSSAAMAAPVVFAAGRVVGMMMIYSIIAGIVFSATGTLVLFGAGAVWAGFRIYPDAMAADNRGGTPATSLLERVVDGIGVIPVVGSASFAGGFAAWALGRVVVAIPGSIINALWSAVQDPTALLSGPTPTVGRAIVLPLLMALLLLIAVSLAVLVARRRP